jgi:hypothetical protein
MSCSCGLDGAGSYNVRTTNGLATNFIDGFIYLPDFVWIRFLKEAPRSMQSCDNQAADMQFLQA